MPSPHVCVIDEYDTDNELTPTHTISIHDERTECGSVTIWAYPKSLPQSMSIAAVVHVGLPPGMAAGAPCVSHHACGRHALDVYYCDGKLILDTKGLTVSRNPDTGLYEVEL